jgi:hypothetical protein
LEWQPVPVLVLVPVVLMSMQVHVVERVQVLELVPVVLVQEQAPESAQMPPFPVGVWSEREPPLESRPRRDHPRCV